MRTSLYRIAEQCKLITEDRVSIQALIEAVKNAYATAAKKIWYENTQFDSTEIDGSFIYTFNKVIPELDCDRNMWFTTIPSSYLVLPHQMGVVWVSYMQDRRSWTLVPNWGIFESLQASVMGGRNPYEIEGNKMWFPKMTSQNKGPLLIKLAIALDQIDVEEELNIAPNIITDVITLVTQPYMVKVQPDDEIKQVAR